ncbi:EAL domain-containing protein [Massilia sp. R2A-15]|uniref:EAL and HDOD domain-containing protein n=1 Tax=Massilia sp. R2A-15 TaxID=3064278 RepID=UPI002733CF9C|nr:EAL domain-containing protein [Massilia sp. R2A-15]WLI89709.1 EAL domain-containing protein [Massilia sp. R2A-15]
MTDYASTSHASKEFGVRDFYLGRQPILDRNQALFGYELLFRGAPAGGASIASGMSATAAVIAHAGQLGLDRVIGDAQAFLNVDADVLMSDIFVFLPREKLVLELVDTVEASAALVDRMAQLAGHGFRFALDDGAANPDFERLLPMADFIKVDTRALTPSALQQLAPRFKRDNKKLVAEKIETRAEYDCCRELGFDYFQGYYFCKPMVIGGRKLTPSQMAITQLLTLVSSDAENIEIERAVKGDVTLALNLLRLVNTPAVGMRQKIDSVSQALIVLGRRQLQRWLQIMLYADPAQRGHSASPLLMLATTRGRLLELLAKRLRPSQRNVADVAFTVGIMSLMDALFGMKMEEIVAQIPVIDEVAAALVHRTGFFGELLKLAESIEQMESGEDMVLPTLKQLAISSEELVEFEVAAYSWSDNVVRYAI